MRPADTALRLSAQRALLGAISAPVRLIKIACEDNKIRFTVICARALSDQERDALTTAAAEIISDFPDCALEENFIVSTAPLPQESSSGEYRIFARLE